MAQLIQPRTKRIQLRQWRSEDREPFAALNADPVVMEHFPQPLARPESDAVAKRLEACISERGWGLWAAELLRTNQFIGFIGLSIPSAPLPFSPCVEIGWRVAKAFWGQGLATEAAQAALAVGFNQLGLPEIVSFTALSNVRSSALMERLHMVRDSETFAHPQVPEGSHLREHCLYRLSREAWCDN